jgi:hypothetical protein
MAYPTRFRGKRQQQPTLLILGHFRTTGTSTMKIGTSLVTASLEILSLAATALLIGCGSGPPGTNEIPTDPEMGHRHTVQLSWTASKTVDIFGYNIYRAIFTNSCGSFSKINSALNTSTQYSDSELTDGASYCYATTAVNVDGESDYSNIVSNVQIPAP